MNAPPEAVELTPDVLGLRWADHVGALSASCLRAACRCGGCRTRPFVPGQAVHLVDAQPVGHYALNLVFSDGHDRGIYPWSWLRELTAA